MKINMPKIDKVKRNQGRPLKKASLLHLPVAVKSPKKKTKKSKTLTKPLSVHSKENTLAYYNCLIDQVANPVNDKVKLVQMCHECKHNKGKVAAAQQEN